MNKLYKKILSKFKKNKNTLIALILILAGGFYLRTFNINWDNGNYFHPDERAIVMTVIKLNMPTTLEEFLSINSPLNPNFFAYGSFPMYLLKAASEISANFNPSLNDYGGVHWVGRFLSALFDTITILIVFLIAKKIFGTKVGLISSLFYALSVLPIQLSHFYAVDTILTTFLTLSFLFALLYMKSPSMIHAILIGLFFGLSLASKISGLIFLPVILLTLLVTFYAKVNFKELKKAAINGLLIAIVSLLTFAATQPYVFIDWDNFILQTSLQSQMSNDPFVFPYTLQYVGKIPYIHELSQIFFWGQGAVLSSLSFVGFLILLLWVFKNKIEKKKYVVLVLFYFGIYFLTFGRFAVGFMRYMLPLYPLLAIFAGWLIFKIYSTISLNHKFKSVLFTSILVFVCIYPFSFISIYKSPNTRIQATEWINSNVPIGSNIAIEHWDDSLPVYGGENFTQIILPLYDPDTDFKWKAINESLEKSDYIFIASNRLYVPLQKLTDCKNLPPSKCYPITANYYKELLSGKRGFVKVAEFTSLPTIPILNLPINDQAAEENFTVFDHPKIMIFKKSQY